jgi:hypothetical protein
VEILMAQRYKKNFKKKKNENSPYMNISLPIPISMYNKLTKASEENQLPMTRLIAFAIDKEFESDSPFSFEMDYPIDIPFIKGEHAIEAVRLIDFLRLLPDGTGIDSLLLFRDDIGLRNKKAVHLAHRELKNAKQIIEFYPKHSSFIYEPGYRYIKISDDPIKDAKKYGPLEGDGIGPLDELDKD